MAISEYFNPNNDITKIAIADIYEERNQHKDANKYYDSIYKNSDNISTQSVRYNLSTHTGLTFYKNIKEGINRLVDSDGIIYNITGANGKGRLNSLLLKVVDVNV